MNGPAAAPLLILAITAAVLDWRSGWKQQP